ncbi:helix-turn-helix domain-containing protein [Methylophaga sp. OBS4]|uniref:helix-turn-helix domain-containing protein n=1 Tax=Methylophaga sp. OBS4 TaxID=2991935 RepID=UPI00225480B0|nr:helix-turn-helix transcriptional regulator [Methylophaga sp. OBS4]MCX4186750.1 helix-turn-helix transcriptional regulator [Methylophaga sp. OBS4]
MDFEVEIDSDVSPLTPAENRVFALLVQGKTQQAMSVILHRSIKTVEAHLLHSYQKLGVDNSRQAITAAFVRGMVRARQILVLCLVLVSAGNAVLPSQAYASSSDSGPEIPLNRLRVRGGARLRTGSQLKLRHPSRRWEG